MSSIPLVSRLKRRLHLSVALAQDVIVAQAYDAFPDCVLHGGTAIWRCYGGGRFSEDVDTYLPTYSETRADRFRRGLKAKGVRELKFKPTGNTVFAKFSIGGATAIFEGSLRRPPGVVAMPYELLAGSYIIVNSVSPGDLVIEKAAAYSSRRKIRDLYDIFFLLGKVEESRKVTRSLKALIEAYEKPVDEAQLRTTVIFGTVPSADQMIEAITKWVRRST